MHLSALGRLFINNSIKSNNSHAYEVAAWGMLVKLMAVALTPPPLHLAGGRLKIESKSQLDFCVRRALSWRMMGALP
jgi:hypothetical protein